MQYMQYEENAEHHVSLMHEDVIYLDNVSSIL